MISFTTLKPQDLMDNWAPIDKVSFKDMQENYGIERGAWVLARSSNLTSHNYWKFYKPRSDESYNLYCLGFSTDPESIFYPANEFNKSARPTIIRSDDHEGMRKIRKHLFDLSNQNRSNPFEGLFKLTFKVDPKKVMGEYYD